MELWFVYGTSVVQNVSKDLLNIYSIIGSLYISSLVFDSNAKKKEYENGEITFLLLLQRSN